MTGPREVSLMAMAMMIQSGNVRMIPSSATTMLSTRRGPSETGRKGAVPSRMRCRWRRFGEDPEPLRVPSIGIVIASPAARRLLEYLAEEVDCGGQPGQRPHDGYEADPPGTLSGVEDQLVPRLEVELVQGQAPAHGVLEDIRRPDFLRTSTDEHLAEVCIRCGAPRHHDGVGGGHVGRNLIEARPADRSEDAESDLGPHSDLGILEVPAQLGGEVLPGF